MDFSLFFVGYDRMKLSFLDIKIFLYPEKLMIFQK